MLMQILLGTGALILIAVLLVLVLLGMQGDIFWPEDEDDEQHP